MQSKGVNFIMYKCEYKTPKEFSNIIMNSDGENLTGLWFEGSRDSKKHISDCEEKKLQINILYQIEVQLYE